MVYGREAVEGRRGATLLASLLLASGGWSPGEWAGISASWGRQECIQAEALISAQKLPPTLLNVAPPHSNDNYTSLKHYFLEIIFDISPRPPFPTLPISSQSRKSGDLGHLGGSGTSPPNIGGVTQGF